MKKTFLFVTAAMLAFGLSGCYNVQRDKGAERETAATIKLQDAANTAVGMPAIKNFTEKRQLKMLYELRDTAHLTTYSYFVDLYGHLHQICPTTSVGYGIPYSAQFTAPERERRSAWINSYKTVWQPEPNGLYMPDSAEATWVLCLAKDKKGLQPVYVEPRIIVSLTPLRAISDVTAPPTSSSK